VILRRLYVIPREINIKKKDGKTIREYINCRIKKIDTYEFETVRFSDILSIETNKLLSHLMIDPESKKAINEVFDYIRVILIDPEGIKFSEDIPVIDNNKITIIVNFDAISKNYAKFSMKIKIRKFNRERVIEIKMRVLREYFNKRMKCSDRVYDYISKGDFLLEDPRFWYSEVMIQEGMNTIEYVAYYIPIIPSNLFSSVKKD